MLLQHHVRKLHRVDPARTLFPKVRKTQKTTTKKVLARMYSEARDAMVDLYVEHKLSFRRSDRQTFVAGVIYAHNTYIAGKLTGRRQEYREGSFFFMAAQHDPCLSAGVTLMNTHPFLCRFCYTALRCLPETLGGILKRHRMRERGKQKS